MSAAPTPLLTESLSPDRKEFLHGLFTTALEGGIGYWSQCSTYHWASDEDGRTEDLDGFHAVIHPTADDECWGIFETNDTRELLINLAVIHKGARWLNSYVQGFVDGKGNPVPLDEVKPYPEKHYLWQFVKANMTNGDQGDYDSEVADMVVQFGLFGEVVYG